MRCVKHWALVLLGVYSLNFFAGYFVCRDKKPARFCKEVIGQAHGWNLAAIMIVLPGESNACLDLGYWPLKDGGVSNPEDHK